MVVRLQPLEFTDCITDSPYFRENLHAHERELQKTSQQIKRLIKEVKDLINAAKRKFLWLLLRWAFYSSIQMNKLLYYYEAAVNHPNIF